VGTVPAGRAAGAGVAGPPQTFRSSTAVIIWWVWLLFAAANLIDLAVQGRDYASLVAAAILLLATGVAYVAARRPRIIADDAGITIRNPLRDHRVGWAGITRIDLTDLLRVHCAPSRPGQQGKVISSWAVHYSLRRKLAAETRARRTASRAGSRRGPAGLPDDGSRRTWTAPAGAAVSPSEAEAERIARLLGERATAARAETVWAEGTAPAAGAGREAGTGWLQPLTSTWSWPAIAALLIPALILLVISLI